MTDVLNEPVRLCGTDHFGPEQLSIAGGRAVVFTQQSPQKHSGNEDAAAVIPVGQDAAILVVADGAGGQLGGAVAAQQTVDALIRSAEEVQGLREAVLDGFEHANRNVLAKGAGAGSTCAAVEISEGGIRPYHVGDSVILLIGGRGRIKHLTVAHSPVGYAVEAGVLHHDDALHHEDLHIVSNMVGMPEMRIDLGPVLQMSPRDTLLIASDGLSDNLRLDEMIELARKGNLVQCAENLMDHALTRMMHPEDDVPSKPDDLTFILYRAQA